MSKVAVVTGSNKGIGLAIVRALCKQYDGAVYLTSRDVKRGEEAVKLLEAEGLKPKFHQLDIEDTASVSKLKDHMSSTYGGIDVLLNNAGFSYKQSDTVEFAIQAEVSVRINYFGTLNASNILLPIVKPGGRVVNVSSMLSQMSMKKCSEEIQKVFRDPAISEEQLTQTMNDFVSSAKAGNHEEKGFSSSACGMSKIGVTVLSRIQARELREQGRNDVLLNACCPGWTSTDIGGSKAPQTPDQGAETPVYLALLAQDVADPHGQFLSNKTVKPW